LIGVTACLTTAWNGPSRRCGQSRRQPNPGAESRSGCARLRADGTCQGPSYRWNRTASNHKINRGCESPQLDFPVHEACDYCQDDHQQNQLEKAAIIFPIRSFHLVF